MFNSGNPLAQNSDAPLGVISKAIIDLRKLFLDEKDVNSLEDINNGLCADFANALWRRVPDVEIMGIYGIEDLCDFPTDDAIIRTAVESDAIVHTFVFFAGKYFDAECPCGTTSPYDLPVIKRALFEWAN